MSFSETSHQSAGKPNQDSGLGGTAGLSETPRGERLHIAIFGRRNVGKSSLINALTNQDVAITSATPGTTTDPVYKAMEILPIGPVVLIDTAGLDDEGTLGKERVKRSLNVLDKTDLALLLIDSTRGWGQWEEEILALINKRSLPVVAVLSKTDLNPAPAARAVRRNIDDNQAKINGSHSDIDGSQSNPHNNQSKTDSEVPAGVSEYLAVHHIQTVAVSAKTGHGIEALKTAIIQAAARTEEEPPLLGDLVNPGDQVILVAPIDRAAPKGRLILPQVQAIRDLLDHRAQALVIQETELPAALKNLREPPRLVVTDSQVFKAVNEMTPPEISLTSFSILFARYKGNLLQLVAGAKAIERLHPGDRVLIAEACTHHRTDDDIGKVKIPSWLEAKVGGKLEYTWSSGGTLPENLQEYRLIVHCGACMLNRRQMLSRLRRIAADNIPVVNYGVAIAYLHGILGRVLSPFPEALRVFRTSE